ncbi:uncharacterized protein NEMAJ01_1176 [Nematocida major]|uniref:uncharacterized protein n=1 Tax=Nematocida major TaxID=1912982 RepID=UPI0020085DFB|nr:uncharacterized protein NEMAJ01_1176 [Nematocida major]KAH9386280.1 hypothetical protein NEMAJ01_1176 [Nematocida major]
MDEMLEGNRKTKVLLLAVLGAILFLLGFAGGVLMSALIWGNAEEARGNQQAVRLEGLPPLRAILGHTAPAAIQHFFSDPRVFSAVLGLEKESLDSLKGQLEDPGKMESFFREMAICGKDLGSSHTDFFGALECLHGIAKGMEAHADRALEACLLEHGEKLVAHLEALFYLEKEKEHLVTVQSYIERLCMSVFRAIWVLCKTCFVSGSALPAENVGAFPLEETRQSVFKVDKEAQRMLYVRASAEPNDNYVGFADVFLREPLPMQRVCYVDNAEQRQKPVVIPQAPAQISCAEIVRYIADTHNRPQDQIHVFLFSLSTRTLTYTSPESTEYFSTCSDAEEILVFYYIPKSTAESASLALVEFRPPEESGSAQGSPVVYLPLFLSGPVPLPDCGAHETGSARPPRCIADLTEMDEEAALVLPAEKPESGHSAMAVDLGILDILKITRAYIISPAAALDGEPSDSCYTISYTTRAVCARGSM